MAAQTRQTLTNIDTVVRTAGATLEDVVKVTVHLQHLHRDFAAFNEVYGEFFPQTPPVRTTVGAELFDGLVEIDAIVALPTGR